MNLGTMIERVRDYISEHVDTSDVNEDNVYFKTDTIIRTINEAQEIIQQKLMEFDVHFLGTEKSFILDNNESELFIPDMFIVLFIKQTNSNGKNPVEMQPFDSSQEFNKKLDYEIFGNKIIFVNATGKRYYKIRYSKKCKELKSKLDISEIPAGFHHVLVKYAASMLLGTDEAFDLATFFTKKYEDGVQEMNNVSINRQHQEPRFVHPQKERAETFMY
jgi:hypothetical protein